MHIYFNKKNNQENLLIRSGHNILEYENQRDVICKNILQNQ